MRSVLFVLFCNVINNRRSRIQLKALTVKYNNYGQQ